MMTAPGAEADAAKVRAAILRGALGVGQMVGATVAAITLLNQGVTGVTLGVTAVTTVLTVISRLLFPRQRDGVRP